MFQDPTNKVYQSQALFFFTFSAQNFKILHKRNNPMALKAYTMGFIAAPTPLLVPISAPVCLSVVVIKDSSQKQLWTRGWREYYLAHTPRS